MILEIIGNREFLREKRCHVMIIDVIDKCGSV
ncbi:hypothetical protein HNR31_002122 [Anoxybacillus caldiproteolyticus]|uniref:Uncharacterized protein n=1 Tax=Thermaerobacillus caldiproteolyticus TaxID=247480 RepID=A0A7W0C0I5_9BACL|nr:hypothetical protein [Anoxybacillus caldiproteolyticus]